MILIDTRPSMFVPSITSDFDLSKAKVSPFQAAIQACEYVLRNKVKNVAVHKTGRRDGVGVLLFGREDESNNNKSVSTLLSLEPPGVDQVKQIRNFNEKELTSKEEASAICPLRDAIFQANKFFQNAKYAPKLLSVCCFVYVWSALTLLLLFLSSYAKMRQKAESV